MALSKLRSGLPLDRQAKEVVSNDTTFALSRKTTSFACVNHLEPTASFARPKLPSVWLNLQACQRKLSTVSWKKRSRVRCNHPRRLQLVLEYWTLSMISSFDICAIRRIVHNMYISWENVNLEILLARVQENLSFFTSKGSQRTLLLQNGVRVRKINVRKILMGEAQSKGIVLCTCR